MTTKAGPFSQADGPQLIDMQAAGWIDHHEISVTITDSIGDPLVPVSGTLEFAVLGIGADTFEPFLENLHLPASERRFASFYSSIKTLRVTPIDLEVGARYSVLIISDKEK